MRTLLLHNPTAGTGQPSSDELMEVIRSAGFTLTYCSTKSSDMLDALNQPGDLVVVAGGDGTVTKVLTQMPDRSVPVAILPLGTANNIARSLGIAGRPQEIVAGWRNAGRQRFDIAVAQGAWGNSRFIEAVGIGALAHAMADIDATEPDAGDKLRVSREAFRKRLTEAPAKQPDISVDGQVLPGDLLLVEVMNIGHVGPNLFLAPSADPGDGLLDVVFVREGRRAEMLQWLGASSDRNAPPVDVKQGREISLTWRGMPLRVGDSFHRAEDQGGTMTIKLEPGYVRVLVP